MKVRCSRHKPTALLLVFSLKQIACIVPQSDADNRFDCDNELVQLSVQKALIPDAGTPKRSCRWGSGLFCEPDCTDSCMTIRAGTPPEGSRLHIYKLQGKTSWVQVAIGMLASAYVESAIYEKRNSSYFYLRFLIVNTTKRKIGVEMKDRSYVLYPYKYQVSCVSYRSSMDDIIAHEIFEKAERNRLIRRYHRRKLTYILPGRSKQYYVAFNAAGRREVDTSIGQYVIISIQGSLLISNGIQSVNFETVMDLTLPCPIMWKKIVRGSPIIP